MKNCIQELKFTNERLLLELGYLQGETMKIDDLKRQILELEKKCERLKEREERAWDRCNEALRQRDLSREVASEAIRQLQVEIERLRVSRETF